MKQNTIGRSTYAKGVLCVSRSPRYFKMAGPVTWDSAKQPGIYSGGGPFLFSMWLTREASHWSSVRRMECSRGLCIGSSVQVMNADEVWIIPCSRIFCIPTINFSTLPLQRQNALSYMEHTRSKNFSCIIFHIYHKTYLRPSE